MDKVIIDRVDVSECDNLAILQDRMTDKEFTFCNAYQEDCSERENCHYKQLQRLKHQYADVLKLAKENADSNEYCIQELEQENKKLKLLLETKCESELEKENERLKEEILKWQKAYSRQYQINENKGYNKKEEQYRQTLQEIKAIVEGCQYGDCHECKYKPADDCRTQLIVNVIAKINEVIGGE